MHGFDSDRLLAALVLMAMALFVAAGYPPAARWRRPLRLAAIVAFATVVVAVFAVTALWWLGSGH